jgi:hypothetical protein
MSATGEAKTGSIYICTEPEYNEGHIEWSHNVMKMKSMA